jgi:hypothetical protein
MNDGSGYLFGCICRWLVLFTNYVITWK